MSPKAIAVAGLSAIAIAASGCGGDSDSGAELTAAFKKDFSTAPWIDHITGVKVSTERRSRGGGRSVLSSWLVVTTDLHKASETVTGAICHAGFQFADDHEVAEGGDRIEAVAIIGPDGEEGGCA